MSLASYTAAPALHEPEMRQPLDKAPAMPVEALRGLTMRNARTYAEEAATRALAALLSGDNAAALAYLAKAQRWDAYASALQR